MGEYLHIVSDGDMSWFRNFFVMAKSQLTFFIQPTTIKLSFRKHERPVCTASNLPLKILILRVNSPSKGSETSQMQKQFIINNMCILFDMIILHITKHNPWRTNNMEISIVNLLTYNALASWSVWMLLWAKDIVIETEDSSLPQWLVPITVTT